MATILHISDLHRTPHAEVSNTVLLHAIRQDLATLSIPIDLVVASGDIIQGSRDGGAAELARQYAEAAAFLEALATDVTAGERGRVVIVPGNHDVDWAASKASMSPIPDTGGDKKALLKQLFNARTDVRWSWSDFRFHRIGDADQYRQRFAAFRDFYNAFYQGARTFSLDPERQFDIFDYPDLNVTLLGLNSCHDNDHCNYAGRINPDCIALAGRELQDPRYARRMRIAVWHHNTKGLPQEANYIDARILANLIDLRFAMGLHGHQHRNDVVDEYAALTRRQRMTLVSAGSLCAGAEEMPTGELRSYNVISIAGNSTFTLRVRKEKSDDPLAPLFGECQPRGHSSTEVEFSLQTFSEGPMVNTLLRDAEKLIASSDFEQAYARLKDQDSADPMVRRLLFECLTALRLSTELVRRFYPPTSSIEALALLPALWEEREHEKLQATLVLPIVADSGEPAMREQRQKYSSLLKAKLARTT